MLNRLNKKKFAGWTYQPRKFLLSFLGLLSVGLLFGYYCWAQPICLLANKSAPKEVPSLDTFQRIAIIQDGRIKPIETYAKNILLQLSGKQQFNHQPAIRWFARLIFAPQSVVDDRIFLINNPEIPMALGIEPDEKRRYSFSALQPQYDKLRELAKKASEIDKKSRTIVDEELIRVETNMRLYAEIANSLTFAFSHPDFTIENKDVRHQLDLSEGKKQFSFLDIALKADLIQTALNAIQGKPESQWSDKDREIIRLLEHLYQWSLFYKNLPLQIIPSLNPQQESWLSPWDAINVQFQQNQGQREVELLKDLAQAYWDGKQLEFDMAARGFIDSIASRNSKFIQKSLKKFPLELNYHRFNLLLWAKLFYGFAFLLFLSSLFIDQRSLHQLGRLIIVGGFAMHTIALILRIIILSRPPVTNLYETFIFVSFMSVLVGMLIEGSTQKWLGIVVSSVSGFILLTIAEKFSAEGDTMQMLVAVLNSNFWLGTHVLSITTGYAGVCVAGILGHVYLLQALFKPKQKVWLETTYHAILGVLGFGLTMTFLGTNLGGIWADQSWGRFWGWDPKENGAMLIVLWCAIIFHARVGKMIGPLGVAVASVFGIIVVGWAWFGVNFLSVGLHSYGFSSGASTGLTVYVSLQILFVAMAAFILKRRRTIL